MVEVEWVNHPAPDARLHVAGQLDVGDALVVLVDVGVGQDEHGQGKQRLLHSWTWVVWFTRMASVAQLA